MSSPATHKPGEGRPAEPEERGTIISDPELKVLGQIGKLLASLDDDARERVLSYINGKFKRKAPQE